MALDNRTAWDLSRRMLEADNLKPSDEMEEMIEKGLSDEEIIQRLQKKYCIERER